MSEPAEKPWTVLDWAREVVHGVGGFHDYERYELAVFEDRDVGLVYFALKSLANPKCEDSGKALEAIRERREELEKEIKCQRKD